MKRVTTLNDARKILGVENVVVLGEEPDSASPLPGTTATTLMRAWYADGAVFVAEEFSEAEARRIEARPPSSW